MPLPVPNLDDRVFQDLVNETRSRIPLYCPEWTDHNLSDPGITLIELFSWMMELVIYRLNKVPDKNYVKFLELIGIRLAPGSPASTDVTLRLAAPQEVAITIPMGTEIATVRTETQDAVVFTTNEDLTITPPQLEHLLLSRDGSQFDDQLPTIKDWENPGAGGAGAQGGGTLAFFAPVPEPGNAFYLGYSSDLRGTTLSVALGCEPGVASGINPSNPPLIWEYWDGLTQDWEAFDSRTETAAWLEEDQTGGLIQPGQLILHIPRTAGQTEISMRNGYWIRCRVVPFTMEQGSYESTPRFRSVLSQAIGGTTVASNNIRVVGELLGSSQGKPGEAMRISETPMLPLGDGEWVEVSQENNTGWEPWQQVSDFSQSGPEDKHFVCDPVAGEILFGPVIRAPDGKETQYGAIPPRGSQVRLSAYRHGGGPLGNVGHGTLSVLKSSIPFIDKVTNFRPATGGAEPETIDNAKLRGPQALRTRHRAVTAEDFEYLAKEASTSVGRAHCVQPQEVGSDGGPPPGMVQVLLVPALAQDRSRVTPEELSLSRELLDQVKDYLDERRLLTTLLVVSEPTYLWVSVDTRVKVRRGADAEKVSRAIEDKLHLFFHPLFGGADGEGWPFGRSLFVPELYAQIQGVAGVDYTEEVQVFLVDRSTGERQEVTQTLLVPADGLLCSHSNTVICS